TISAGIHALSSGWAAEAVYHLSHFLYYFLSEAFYSRTVGKHLMGLRVGAASGAVMTFRQTLWRNLAFAGIMLPAAVLKLIVGPVPPWTFVHIVPYLSPMRREKGFAGPHELASSPRVRAPAHMTEPPRRHIRLGSEVRTTYGEGRPNDFGPYRVLKDLWRVDS